MFLPSAMFRNFWIAKFSSFNDLETLEKFWCNCLGTEVTLLIDSLWEFVCILFFSLSLRNVVVLEVLLAAKKYKNVIWIFLIYSTTYVSEHRYFKIDASNHSIWFTCFMIKWNVLYCEVCTLYLMESFCESFVTVTNLIDLNEKFFFFWQKYIEPNAFLCVHCFLCNTLHGIWVNKYRRNNGVEFPKEMTLIINYVYLET